MQSVIVLGAKGRFGRAATAAFQAAGWRVTEAARHWDAPTPLQVTLDLSDASALAQSTLGHDVIVNALHPPYPAWSVEVPRITDAVIAAARASGATVMIPGNIYNYGSRLPTTLSEHTPWIGDHRKAAIRIQMEQAYQDSGVRTIVLRAGDFFEAAQTGNWFDSHIAHKAWAGKVMYPGPHDVNHAWAWLPDMARGMVALAEARKDFATFEEFGFPGYTLTGAALIRAIETAVGRPVRTSGMPWWALRVLGAVNPLMREVAEMRYLWTTPHEVDGAKFRAAVPDFKATPLQDAITAALRPYDPGRKLPEAALLSA